MTKAPSYTYAGGVLSEGLYGRVDLEKYRTGLKKAENFNISVEGGVEKRFGSYFVGYRNKSLTPSRLIPWRLASDDSYILEFYNGGIRFIRFGGLVSMPPGYTGIVGNQAYNNAEGYMVVNGPWISDDLPYLKWTSANDTFEIACKGYPVYVLKRYGLYDWTLAAKNFSPHPAGPTGLTPVYHNDTTVDDNYDDEPVDTSYCVSYTDANGVESLPSAVATISADTGHQRCYVTMTWTAVAGAIQYTVYKGKNGIFGFIGYTTSTSYEDRNYAPAYDTVPIGDSYAFPDGENPLVTEFYKQRQVYGGFISQRQRMIFSKPLIFNSLRHSVPQQNDDAIDVTLIGRERHNINHMVEMKKFIVFTDTAEWIIGAENNAALTIATIDPVLETSYGAHPYIKPIPIGNRILFVQNMTEAIRDMGYEYSGDALVADDLSRLARDLFKRKNILNWGYALAPSNLLFVPMSDGTTNVMAYAREHEIWGWSSYTTEGEYTDVACVDENDITAVYFQVTREINGVEKHFIERQEISYSDRIEELIFTDCSLSYISELSFSNLTKVSSTELTFEVSGAPYSVGDELQIETVKKQYIRAEVTDVTGNVVTVSPLRVSTFQSINGTTGSVYLCADVITGFDHLYGNDVWILADGFVFKTIAIAADGSITLPSKFARVHVGLPYTATMETLDLDIKNAEGMAYDRTVDTINIRLRNSRGVGIQATQAREDREPYIIPSRNDEDMYSPGDPLDGVYEVPSHVGWGMEAGIRVISDDPLPCNVLNIIPDLKYGN